MKKTAWESLVRPHPGQGRTYLAPRLRPQPRERERGGCPRTEGELEPRSPQRDAVRDLPTNQAMVALSLLGLRTKFRRRRIPFMAEVRAGLLHLICALPLVLLSGCAGTDDGSSSVYYGAGLYDPWYYGSYYDDVDVIVTPPDRPTAPPRPTHPIAPTPAPRPTPMPSIPSMPRPSFRR
jgi:hypothetical protein